MYKREHVKSDHQSFVFPLILLCVDFCFNHVLHFVPLMSGSFANAHCFNRPWQLTLCRCSFASVLKTKCVCACKTSISVHVSICALIRVCGWAPCQSLSDSTPSCWRIFVSETNGTERINYCHNVGDMPELLGGGEENKLFPCTLCFCPPPFLLLLPPTPQHPPPPPLSANDRLKVVTCPFSSRHQASVEHRREMAPIPDTPQKPQSHPIIRLPLERWRRTPCGLEA